MSVLLPSASVDRGGGLSEVLTTGLVWTSFTPDGGHRFLSRTSIPESPAEATSGTCTTGQTQRTDLDRCGGGRPRRRRADRHRSRRHGAGGGHQCRQELRLRIRALGLDLFRGQRIRGRLPRPFGRRGPAGHPRGAGQRQVHAGCRRAAQLDVHAERLGAGRLRVPRGRGDGDDGRVGLDARQFRLETAHDQLQDRSLDPLGDHLHQRVVRPEPLLRGRPLGPRARRRRGQRPGAAGARHPRRPRRGIRDLVVRDAQLGRRVRRDRLPGLPLGFEDPVGERDLRDGLGADGRHLLRVPGLGGQLGRGVGEVGRGHRQDGRGRQSADRPRQPGGARRTR